MRLQAFIIVASASTKLTKDLTSSLRKPESFPTWSNPTQSPANIFHSQVSSGKPSDVRPQYELPANVKVIGMVFYGRRQTVRSLDCYLRRNLKKNGGMIDEVIFAMNMGEGSRLKPEDKKYLEEELLPSEPAYRSWVAGEEWKWWHGNWAAIQDPDAIYLKIDDDVVFIEDTAIPSIVKRLYENEDVFAVSANVVNNPALSWIHNHMGVYHPYWPVRIV